MDPNSKKVKSMLIIGGAVYLIGSIAIAIFIVAGSVECVTGNDSTTEESIECIDGVESRSAIPQILLWLLQVGGVAVVIYLLLRHHKNNRKLYGRDVAPGLDAANTQSRPARAEEHDDQSNAQH